MISIYSGPFRERLPYSNAMKILFLLHGNMHVACIVKYISEIPINTFNFILSMEMTNTL